MRKNRISILFLIFSLCFDCGFADRAHEIAKMADIFVKANARNAAKTELYKEDAHYSDILGPVSTNDVYLSFLKNQSTLPDFEPEKFLTANDFKILNASSPAGINEKNRTNFAGLLADLGEGNIYGIVGYVYYVSSGTSSSAALSCGHGYVEVEPDFRIGIGFDEAVAKEIRTGSSPSQDELAQKSIVVEMTQQFRANGVFSWSIPLLNAELGHPVKVVGQLILDNSDFQKPPGAFEVRLGTTSAPFSYWKIRPVTRFYISKSDILCAPDSPDWKKIEEIIKE